MADPVFVTQPFLPPLEEFLPYLETIWERKILTNNGPFHRELEEALADYLGVEHVSLFANGTLALVTALQALRVNGEVITTPYSFPATSHSLLWNNISPVFVDIEPASCNLDPDKIEQAITRNTTAILPVHCYGNPCRVEKIREIADVHGLKVIYDAAHAFGVRYRGENLLRYGDLSVLSFHATKVFTTLEGGAVISPDASTKQRIDYLKNFGFANEVTVTAPGINGKMNEVSAALGLLQLRYIDRALEARRRLAACYREGLADLAGISQIPEPPDTVGNASYVPIFVGPDYPLSRDELYSALKENGINGRRYFYPLISDMPMYKWLPTADPANLPVAHSMSGKVICLPLFPDLPLQDVERIVARIRSLS